nr:MAG TPA: hypothetical protein [Caudoviricetes sp.]DAJ58816.1 MAG TPA: hypothetical protein [Caudoviricetes sp.]
MIPYTLLFSQPLSTPSRTTTLVSSNPSFSLSHFLAAFSSNFPFDLNLENTPVYPSCLTLLLRSIDNGSYAFI